MRAAWQWGRESRIVNNPLGEPDSTPLYVELSAAWGSVDSDIMFFLIL
jgi:hypothetical protein